MELWCCSGHDIPKAQLVFFCQVILVYIVVIVCIVNLTIGVNDNQIWIILLSSSLGYLLPSPSVKNERILYQSPEQHAIQV